MKHTFITLCCLWLFISAVSAQHKYHQSPHDKADSLIRSVQNMVFTAYQSPSFSLTYHAPTFTVLRAVIDSSGKLNDIIFSDSADSAFVAVFVHEKRYQATKRNISEYAKKMGYKDISILIPIYYETNAETGPELKQTYNQIENFMKFGNKNLTGNCVFLNPVKIILLSKGNS